MKDVDSPGEDIAIDDDELDQLEDIDTDQPESDDDSTLDPEVARRPSVRQRGFRRKKSIPRQRMTRAMLSAEWLRLGPDAKNFPRPLVREECLNMIRPCPYVGCRHHNYLDVNPKTGSITLNWPDHEPHEMPVASCSLDVAARGGLTHEDVGVNMNITRERVRQIEIRALLQLRMNAVEGGLEGPIDGHQSQTPLGEIADRADCESDTVPSDVSYQTY